MQACNEEQDRSNDLLCLGCSSAQDKAHVNAC